jgi:hypothetical protein
LFLYGCFVKEYLAEANTFNSYYIIGDHIDFVETLVMNCRIYLDAKSYLEKKLEGPSDFGTP